MNAYNDAEASRRRACGLHVGAISPYCFPCNERERTRPVSTINAVCDQWFAEKPPTTDDAAGEGE